MNSDPLAAVPMISAVLSDSNNRGELAEGIRLAGLAPSELCAGSPGDLGRSDFSTAELVALDARGAAEPDLIDSCSAIARAALPYGLPVVVVADPDQIDLVARWWIEWPHRILCDPAPLDIAVALVSVRSRARTSNVGARDDAENLRRLNSEVARIAETLARLTEAEEIRSRRDLAKRDRSVAFVAPISNGVVHEESRVVRNLIRARRMRDSFFAPEMFADPAWDMLLDLYAAELEDRRVSVSSLCIAASVPGTTALRWIGTMMEAGLLERHADPFDRRRAYISLSSTARESMQRYFDSVQRAGILPL